MSEQPNALDSDARQITQAQEGRLGLRARVRYQDIETIAEEQIPKTHPVKNSKRVCKSILTLKACGTARWDIIVHRENELKISGNEGEIQMQVPLSFTGMVGINGKIAKTLGFSKLNVYGSLLANMTLGLEMGEDWCPKISAKMDYKWLQQPTIVWGGMLDFNLEKTMNEALNKQLTTLEPRLNEAIDCTAFRKQLENHWRSYTFALDLPVLSDSNTSQQVHLNIVPTGFAFSGIRTESDKMGVSFTLDATTVVANEPISVTPVPLPTLKEIDFQSSKTDFDILIRADYAQIQQVLEPRVTGIQYSADSPAGKVNVNVTTIELSGNTHGITVALGFTAQLPGSRADTRGVVYLNASPEVDVTNETLYLRNIRLSKVIDSTLWSIIGNIFEGQIIAAIERNAVFDLSERARKLENRLADQLRDSTRTGGIEVQVKDLTIQLLDILPELHTLAARARVSAELDIDIPLTVIQNR